MPDQIGQGKFRLVKLADLETDGRFNRPVSQAWVEHLAQSFSADKFTPLILSLRSDGTLVIIDGQHRVAAARMRGVPEDVRCLPAIVFEGLTLDQEAELFVGTNDTRTVGPYPKYHAKLAAGDPETHAIDAIVKAHDLTVAAASGDGHVSAVTALYALYNLGEPEGAVLGRTLATIRSAWGEDAQAYRATVMSGIGLYIHAHRDTDPHVLAAALVSGPGEPFGLIGWGKSLAGTQRLPLKEAIAQVIEKRVMKRPARPRKTA